jgi:membrane-associated phospholipid phosphatase
MRGWSSWWWDALAVGGLIGVTVCAATGVTSEVDLAVRDWCDGHRPPLAYWTARVFNLLGQGWLLIAVTAAPTLYLVISRRSWRYVLPGLAAYLLSRAGTGLLKLWSDRAAPRADIMDGIADPVRMFHYDAGLSYPSGHVVNTIVWWGAFVLLLRQITRLPTGAERWLRYAPPAIVLATTTYLSFHWLTDGLAAIFLGLFTWRLFLRLPWDRMLSK